MSQKAKRLKLSDKGVFSWGYVDNVQSIDMQPYFSPFLRNCRLNWQSIEQRPWHNLFASLTAWDYPRWIWSYLRNWGDTIVVRHNKDADEKLVTITEGWTITNVNTDGKINSNNRMTFTNVWNLLYCMNWADLFGKLDWTTYSAPDTKAYYKIKSWSWLDDLLILQTPQVSHTYIIEIDGTSPNSFKRNVDWWSYTTWVHITWWSQLLNDLYIQFNATTGHTIGDKRTISTWFAPAFSVVFNWSNRASWRTLAPNVVFKSIADKYEIFWGSWSDDFTFWETIVWLATNNEALFYFTKNTISITSQWDIQDTAGVVSYITRPLQTKDWAANHASIVTAWTDIYYLSSSNSINQIARGNNIYWFEVLELSDREYQGIEWLMSTLDSNQTESFGYFLPDVMLIKRHLRTAWATYNDICIVYDIVHKRFFVDNQKYFYWGVYFKGKNYTISNIEEKVYIDEYSNEDENSVIPFEYRTKKFYVWWATRKNILRWARSLFDINELAELTQKIYVDGKLADTRVIDWDDFLLQSWGIGVEAIGEIGIWTSEEDEEMIEIPVTRTKGNLNVKWRTIQVQYTNAVTWSKVRLKDLMFQVEKLPDLSNV